MKFLADKIRSVIILIVFFSSYSVNAAGISFTPRVSTGYLAYRSEVLGTNVNFDYIFGGLGLTAQYGRFFADLYGQTDLVELGEGDANADFGKGRQELNFTAGYGLTPNISLFGGYKYAETDFLSLEYGGPFFGGSFSVPVFDAGALSFNAAVAYLQEFQTSGEQFDTTSVGLNGGVSWSSDLNWLLLGLGYGLSLDYSGYTFEDDGDEIINEKIFRTRFDLKYAF